jgi:manganese/zinc/iron transport system permease protein
VALAWAVVVAAIATLWWSPLLYYNTKIVLLGTSLMGASAGMVGTFTVLRRRALIGDALAHSALPGLCLAFLFVGRRHLPTMMLGALLAGILGTAIVTFLRRYTRIKEDAAIGIVLSVFFGIGMALISVIQRTATGQAKSGLDAFIFGKTAGMIREDVELIALAAGVCALAVTFVYKEFKLVAFDADFARAQGWPVGALDMFLMGLIAVTVVIGLPAVGVVLMAALLILPAAAARFWTDRLTGMLLLSAGLGASMGILGTALSANVPRMPTGPSIVLVGAIIFVASLLLAPRRGLIAAVLTQRQFRMGWEESWVLREIYSLIKTSGSTQSVTCGALERAVSLSRHRLHKIVRKLAASGRVNRVGRDSLDLTPAGEVEGRHLFEAWTEWAQLLEDRPELARQLAQEDVSGMTQSPRMLPGYSEIYDGKSIS